MLCCLEPYDRQNMHEKLNSSVAANFRFLLLRVRGDPLFFTLHFIDFVKIRRDNKGNLLFRKMTDRSPIPDRFAIFRKIRFPLLSRRILTKAVKYHVKNKGSPLARGSNFQFLVFSKKWKFVLRARGDPLFFT